LGYTIKEFEVLMSKVIGDSPFSLSPSPTQDSILKSPQHVLKMIDRQL